ncbi:hypothetical protein VTK56DRAFT_5146 [Thermocarpiscus australiensis]
MMDPASSPKIRRKPVAASQTTPLPVDARTGGRASDQKPAPLPERPDPGDKLRVGTQIPARPVSRGGHEAYARQPLLQAPQDLASHRLRPQTSLPDLSRSAARSSSPSPPNPEPISAAATFGPGITSKKTLVKNALSEARHFAGGLIPHPTESTKHYTILRHSPALVFYRGPPTSVAITIFSSPDRPLPADRSLWLQRRGFSGDSGMKIKAFFNATDDWLHVTPATRAQVEQLEPDTERAWQRDIRKAASKLAKERGPEKAHIPRETHVVRIPEASDDGYFRLILCTGGEAPELSANGSSRRKTLCASPVFRVASSSTDSSVFRGASLTTLPLEVGVYVASMVANTTINGCIAPIYEPVEAVIGTICPGFVAEAVGGLAYGKLTERAAARCGQRDQPYFAAHQRHAAQSLAPNNDAIHPIGPDSGPEPPFPLKFQGKVVPGTGHSQPEPGLPTATLSNVPDDIKHRLHGVYFGWANLSPPASKQPTRAPSQDLPTSKPDQTPWHEAIITVAPPSPSPSARPSVAPLPLITLTLIHPGSSSAAASATTPSLLLASATAKVLVMGFLRPPSPSSPPPPPQDPPTPLQHSSSLDADAASTPSREDVSLALTSLSRARWTADAAVARLKELKRQPRGLGERLEDARDKVVRRAEGVVGVPLRRVVGIRGGFLLSGAEERDRVVGVGGYWVAW